MSQMSRFDLDNGDSPKQWVSNLVRFNLQPVLYADPSWLPSWLSVEVEALSPRMRDALSGQILREHGLDNCYDWAVKEPGARLFMIEPLSRDQLALAIGVAAQRDTLRRVVLKSRLASLHSCLGDALDVLWLPISETVERSFTPISISWEPFCGDLLRKALMLEGYRQILRLADPAHRALWGRIVLSTPRTFNFNQISVMNTAASDKLVNGIVSDLIPRLASSWTWLF